MIPHSRDGDTIYSPDGETLGSIHQARSKKWYVKRGAVMTPARWRTPEDATAALREGAC